MRTKSGMRWRVTTGALAAILFCTLSNSWMLPAQAGATVKQYRDYKKANSKDWRDMVIYIVGLEAGFGWSNATLKLNNSKAVILYCQPAKLRMTAALAEAIIDQELKAEEVGIGVASSLSDNDPLEPLFLMGLIHKYPC